jgi:hydroxypyruvate reductase
VLSPNNVSLTKKILSLTHHLRAEDVVLCLISGGGSALFANPHIPLEKYQKLTKALLKSGAEIHEMNTVRKHVDGVKGGRFATHCYPATVVTLLVSDVPGNEPAFIASGPTVRDKTTNRDAQRIVAKYGLPQVPFSETPKNAKLFKQVHNIMALDNVKAVNAMAVEARKLGLKPHIVTTKLSGEARDTGIRLLHGIKKKTAVIAAGETTVTVTGHGKGGRNQEVVTGSIHLLSTLPHCALASMGTDGIDNTPAAGAIADDKTLAIERKKGLRCTKALENNDSYPFLKKLKKLIITGPTGTNVSDIMVAVRF